MNSLESQPKSPIELPDGYVIRFHPYGNQFMAMVMAEGKTGNTNAVYAVASNEDPELATQEAIRRFYKDKHK
jgi:hypothetical protein